MQSNAHSQCLMIDCNHCRSFSLAPTRAAEMRLHQTSRKCMANWYCGYCRDLWITWDPTTGNAVQHTVCSKITYLSRFMRTPGRPISILHSCIFCKDGFADELTYAQHLKPINAFHAASYMGTLLTITGIANVVIAIIIEYLNDPPPCTGLMMCYGCGGWQPSGQDDMRAHLKLCPALEFCVHCLLGEDRALLDVHRRLCKAGAAETFPCKHCFAPIFQRDRALHELRCIVKPVKCGLCGRKNIKQSEFENHLASLCPSRPKRK